MNREDFLNGIAARLGHARSRAIVSPPITGVVKKGQPLDPESRIRTFQQALERVGGRVRVAETLADLGGMLRAELDACACHSLVAFARSEFSPWALGAALAGLDTHYCPEPSAVGDVARPSFREAAFTADAGITTVDYGLVDTGSLVITTGVTRPRSVSLVPKLHLALVHEQQLVDDLGEAFRLLPGRLPSAVQVVTGPSRTSDIENDLTIGVHGPAAVCVLLLRGPLAGLRSAA